MLVEIMIASIVIISFTSIFAVVNYFSSKNEKEHKCQQKRIVPRTHDQNVSVRGRFFIADSRKIRDRRGNDFFRRIGFHMADHVADFAQYKTGLAHEAFEGTLAEVGGQSGLALGSGSADKNVVTKQDITVNKVVSESRYISFRDDTYSVDSKSRFADIVDKIPFDADEFIKAMKDAILAEQAKGTKTLEETKKEQVKAQKEAEEKAKAYKEIMKLYLDMEE